MAWGGVLGQARLASDGRVVTPCTFTSDDGATVAEEFFGTDPNTAALAVIDQLNAASDFLTAFQPGDVAAVAVPTPPVVIAPVPPAPSTLVVFQQAVQAVANLQRAVDLGFETQASLDAAKAAAQALYSPGFLGQF
jgi:hypothetical protein